MSKLILIISFLFVIGACDNTDKGESQVSYELKDNLIQLESDALIATINPSTLETKLRKKGIDKEMKLISDPVFNRDDAVVGKKNQSIYYSELKARITFTLDNNVLKLTSHAEKPQSLNWPTIKMAKKDTALIWPHFEGNYIPLNDAVWTEYLQKNEWNTLEHQYMPFWGIETGKEMVSYIIENPFHNSIKFTEKADDFYLNFTHTFTDNNDLTKPVTIRVYLDHNESPITPAKHFRQLLKEQNSFVTLDDKMKIAPRIKKMIGAPHAYVWDGSAFTVKDVQQNEWISFTKAIVKQVNGSEFTPGKKIFKLLSHKRNSILKMSQSKQAEEHLKRQIAASLSEILLSPRFYDKRIWPQKALSQEHKNTVNKLETPQSVPKDELVALNSYLLYSSFQEYLTKPSGWGNGLSTRMIDKLSQNGFDKFLLSFDVSWEKAEVRPEVAKYAEEKGFLYGPYDSFDSVHDPQSEQWLTAKFNQKLYDEGRILKLNGQPYKGFNGIGYKLSPIFARSEIEKRVTENFKNVPYSYYFIDCDAYGEFWDDYSPGRNVSQSEDAAARVDRVNWIFENFKVPVGSEGGSYLFAKSLAVAEGVFFPTIGWGDADIEHDNEMSKYFVGAPYPPEEPENHFKSVPLKEKYVHLFSDPRFRLPLYEAVFHDSIITSSHYASSSLKFANIAETNALTEILYQVAPLYQLNLDRFEQDKEQIKHQSKVFEKTHSYSYQYALESFDYLTPDRNVQKTTFGDLELVANYKSSPVNYKGSVIPARSVLVNFIQTGESFIHQNTALAYNEIQRSTPDLIKALSSSEWTKRLEAAKAIKLIGVDAKGTIPTLIKHLKDKEWMVRESVAAALANMGHEAEPALHALTKALSDKEWQVRKAAAYALVVLGPKAEPAFPELMKKLGDKEWQVRKPAVMAMGTIGCIGTKAIPTLKKMFDDPVDQIVHRAKRVIGEIDQKNCPEAISEEATIKQFKSPNIDDLIKRLSNPDWKERKKSAITIARMGIKAKKAIPALIKQLKDKKWKVRKAAAYALTKMGKDAKPAVQSLIVALEDEKWQVRRPAAFALEAIGEDSKSAVPSLIKALKDKEWQVRRPAAMALGSIGSGAKRAVPELLKLLDDEEWQVQKAAILAISEIGDKPPSVITALNEKLNDPDNQIVIAAKKALEKNNLTEPDYNKRHEQLEKMSY